MKKNHWIAVAFIGVFVAAAIIVATVFINGRDVNTSADMLSLGERYLLEMQFEQALVQFLGLIEIEPNNVRAYIGAAEAFIGLGQRDNAVNILRQGLEYTGDVEIAWAWISIDPDNGQVYLEAAEILINMGDTASAVDILLTGLERTGDEAIRSRLIALGVLEETLLEQTADIPLQDDTLTHDNGNISAQPFSTTPMMTLHNYFGAYLRDDGTVFAWTHDGFGSWSQPEEITVLDEIVFIYEEGGVIYFLQSNGNLWALSGGLGNVLHALPTMISTDINVDDLIQERAVPNTQHTNMEIRNGYVWSGNNRINNISNVVKVVGLVALRSDGTVWFINDIGFDIDYRNAIDINGTMFLHGWAIFNDFPSVAAYSAIQIEGISDVIDITRNGVPMGVDAIRNDGSVWTVWQGSFDAVLNRRMMTPEQRMAPDLIAPFTDWVFGQPSLPTPAPAMPSTTVVYDHQTRNLYVTGSGMRPDAVYSFRLWVTSTTPLPLEISTDSNGAFSLFRNLDEFNFESGGTFDWFINKGLLPETGEEILSGVLEITPTIPPTPAVAAPIEAPYTPHEMFEGVFSFYRATGTGDIHYAFYDINSDGIVEMIVRVSSPWDEDKTIYTFESGMTYQIGHFWSRNSLVYICGQGILYNFGGGGAFTQIYETFRISDDKTRLISLERWVSDDGVITHTQNGVTRTINAEEFSAAFDSDFWHGGQGSGAIEHFTWHPLG